MKRITNIAAIVSIATLSATALVSLAGCDATDAVAKYANATFREVLKAPGISVTKNADASAWGISSPTGETLSLSADFSGSDKPDAAIAFDAAPFLAAGLDPAKLPATGSVRYALKDGRIDVDFDIGTGPFGPSAKESAATAFAELVRTERARIGYHEKLDHYGIKLGNGNMFEWARDMKANDKDIVFVLDPAPFIAAGTDPEKIEGWAFAKVEIKDDAGKTVFADKILKPFNLE